jgi:NADH:ubiquinone oxidoreductase subunit 5 (subunit L)/multisubunit Na+/H+ antiporter MnhA subunit
MMLVATWGLAGLPPFATYFGEELIARSASAVHLGWLSGVSMFAEVLTSAAVLRFAARVFFGRGRAKSITAEGAPHMHMEAETGGQHQRVPVFMWAPMAALLAAAVLIVIPLHSRVDRYAQEFESTATYRAAVLQDAPAGPLAPELPQRAKSLWWTRLVVALAMFGIAALSLHPETPSRRAGRPLRTAFAAILKNVRGFQSGRVGDYVAWFAFGIAAYGGMLLLLR